MSKNKQNDPIVEMHDIGKMVDRSSLKKDPNIQAPFDYGHSFLNFDELQEVLTSLALPAKMPLTWHVINHHHFPTVRKYIKDHPSETPTPQLIRCKGNNSLAAKSRALILTQLADRMASSFRVLDREQEEQKGDVVSTDFFRLWRDTYEQTNTAKSAEGGPLLINEEKELKELIDSIDTIKNGKAFLASDSRYYDLLRRTPEDKGAPNDVTSLHTHLTLVRQFYNLFDRHYTNADIEQFLAAEAICVHRGVIVHCTVNFPHYIYDAKDLQVFNMIKDKLERIRSRDEVLFINVPHFYFFLPVSRANLLKTLGEVSEDESKQSEMLFKPNSPNDDKHTGKIKQYIKERIENTGFIETFTDAGFSVWTRAVYDSLYYITSTPNDLYELYKSDSTSNGKKERKSEVPIELGGAELPIPPQQYFELNFQPEMKDELVITSGKQPCEMCQQRLAEVRIEKDSSVCLCDTCKKIKNYKPQKPFDVMEDWKDRGNPPRLAWVKICLDIDYLARFLDRLYRAYHYECLKDKKGKKKGKKRENTPKEGGMAERLNTSAIAEFMIDYRDFTEAFDRDIRKVSKDIARGQRRRDQAVTYVRLTTDYLVLNLGPEYSGVSEVLETFRRLMATYFPKFCEHYEEDNKQYNSPIRLVISCANAKYPFFEHWNIVKRAEKIFEERLTDIHINLITAGTVNAKLEKLGDLIARLRRFGGKHSTALHKLAEISRYSEELALAMMRDKKAKHAKGEDEVPKEDQTISDVFSDIKDPVKELGLTSFTDLLTLSKIFGSAKRKN